MAQTGFTPIQLYSSSTATNVPLAANLANGELAINITDGKLFYKDNAAAVQVIGWKTVPTSAGGTGLTSYAAGDLTYYASGTAFTKLGIGTAYQALQVNAGATAPSWQPSASSVLTTQGDLLYASGANTLARLAKDANATRYLSNTGTSNNPAWAQINLANGVTGTLPGTSGGTGANSAFTANGLVYASSTSALATGSTLTFDGTNLLVGDTTTIGTGGKFQVKSNLDTSIFKCTSNTTYAAIVSNVEDTNARLMAFQYGSGGSPTNVGTITTNGTITVYGGTSDYRLKTVIGAVTGHGERIDALEPVEYTWNSNGSHTRGFLAHKFQEVYADSVAGTKDAVDAKGNPEYQSMQAGSSEVIADLVAEIQSLRKRLAILEAK